MANNTLKRINHLCNPGGGSVENSVCFDSFGDCVTSLRRKRLAFRVAVASRRAAVALGVDRAC